MTAAATTNALVADRPRATAPTKVDEPQIPENTATVDPRQTSSTPTASVASSVDKTDGEEEEDVLTDATCVEFLDIMKAFSESACNVSEMVQRVDSLVHQDEQLLRLLPLARRPEDENSADALRASTGSSLADMTDDENMRMDGDVDTANAHEMLTKEDVDDMDVDMVMDGDDDEDTNSSVDGASVDVDGSVDVDADLDPRITGSEQENDEDLQRWMELELDLDTTSDPYDATLHLSDALDVSTHNASANAHNGPLSKGTGTTVSNAKSRLGRSLTATSVFDKKSVTAALFEDDDEDDNDGDNEEDDDGDLVLLNSLPRQKTLTTISTVNKTTEQESKTEESDDDLNAVIWGMEVDAYEQDLLSSIDHAVLCDRENRFLQWDLEIEAATAAAAAAAAASNTPVTHVKPSELRTPPASLASASTTGFTSLVGMDSARQKLLMASSPRDNKMHHLNSSMAPMSGLRSPSNVDTNLQAEDWNTLDFGTFQNRTVSHILSSCLHKRKLHHPYKDRVTLINFNVPGGEPIGPLPSQSSSNGLFYGGSVTSLDGLHHDILFRDGSGKATTKTGERKPKKPREDRKRQLSQKMPDGNEMDGSFNEYDLDGRASKMIKLENLPLPDLTNLPQDLKELKRKIEATEHKVEGTKHRHRKGGPCPRCQVQNQLRAAKRAYHKRAVAHKKLPQLGGVSPAALTATPVASTPTAAHVPATSVSVTTASVSVATTPSAALAATLKVPASVPAPSIPASATPAPASGLTTLTRPQVATNPSPTAALTAAAANLHVSVAVNSSAVPGVVKPPVIAGSVPASTIPTANATALPQSYARRPCGENAVPSPFASPASASSTPSSSPEASPSQPMQHVTVSSA
ncbi:hypothetical protein Poli38472_006922 [Pythium oligandrum]|uniref:Uncharacterized protein n=1 Tax=Pythium oligandrum TaxID=41045 RepID=A0A8K1C903_PYTOL|nr:hypothetical protein Poli38472_006922 [Pythium oligandrum]|eukprot:TMW58777.1 hypothetical protein Poli38472_006922 [Pythium oligandrum]